MPPRTTGTPSVGQNYNSKPLKNNEPLKKIIENKLYNSNYKLQTKQEDTKRTQITKRVTGTVPKPLTIKKISPSSSLSNGINDSKKKISPSTSLSNGINENKKNRIITTPPSEKSRTIQKIPLAKLRAVNSFSAKKSSNMEKNTKDNAPSTSKSSLKTDTGNEKLKETTEPEEDNNFEYDCVTLPIREVPTSSNSKSMTDLHLPAITLQQHYKEISQPDNGKSQNSSSSSSKYESTEIDVKNEQDRLKTYKNWPNKFLTPERLAKAGFYSLGVSDIVKCAFCGIEGFKWVSGDDPMADHSKWNPSCSFVRNHANCRNEHDSAQSARGEDTCGKFGIQYFPKSVPEDENTSLEKFGIKKTKGPAHTEYTSVESRLKSFTDWPKSLKQKPVELAEAGFYYLGTGDQTLCFYCGGGLKDWEDSDDPWEQHALWFPKCIFLLLKKGEEYVKSVNNKEVVVPEVVKEEINPSSSSSNSNLLSETKEIEEVNGVIEKSSLSSDPITEVKDSHLCKICYKNELAVVFLPCGHMVACVDCATALRQCAVCRKPVEATVRAFLS